MSGGSKFPFEMVDLRRTPVRTPQQVANAPMFVAKKTDRPSLSPCPVKPRPRGQSHNKVVRMVLLCLVVAMVHRLGPCFIFYPFYDSVEVDFRYLNLDNECVFFRDLTKYRREIHRVMVRKYADTPAAGRDAFLRTSIDRIDLQDIVERKLAGEVKGMSRLAISTLFEKAVAVNKARGVLIENSLGLRLKDKPAFVTLDAVFIYDSDTFWVLAATAATEVLTWCILPIALMYLAYKACCVYFYDYQAEHRLYACLRRILEKEGPLTPQELYHEAVVELKGKLSRREISDLWPSPGVPLGTIETRLRLDPTLNYTDEGDGDPPQFLISVVG